MKEFAQRKQGQISLVAAPASRPSKDVFDYSPMSLDRSFQGWLHAVRAPKKNAGRVSRGVGSEISLDAPVLQTHKLRICPAVSELPTPQKGAAQNPAQQALTTQDFIKVMLVTLREGFTHRRWPMDTVARFLAAEVIVPQRKRQQAESRTQQARPSEIHSAC